MALDLYLYPRPLTPLTLLAVRLGGVLKEELDKRLPILPPKMSLVTANTEQGGREGGIGREGGREGRPRLDTGGKLNQRANRGRVSN